MNGTASKDPQKEDAHERTDRQGPCHAVFQQFVPPVDTLRREPGKSRSRLPRCAYANVMKNTVIA